MVVNNHLENHKYHKLDSNSVKNLTEKIDGMSPLIQKRQDVFFQTPKCTYIKPFLNILKFFFEYFKDLKSSDLIYNSEEIRIGEIAALKHFWISNKQKLAKDPYMQIQDLIGDEFFEVENLKVIYNDFIKALEKENKKLEANLVNTNEGTLIDLYNLSVAYHMVNENEVNLDQRYAKAIIKDDLLSENTNSLISNSKKGYSVVTGPSYEKSLYTNSHNTLYEDLDKYFKDQLKKNKESVKEEPNENPQIQWRIKRIEVFKEYLSSTLKDNTYVLSEE